MFSFQFYNLLVIAHYMAKCRIIFSTVWCFTVDFVVLLCFIEATIG